MNQKRASFLEIKGAQTNNLQGVNVQIPHHQMTVVTGVSGSGKSSLVFDVIAKEGQRRFFETLPAFSRQFLGKLNPSEVDSITGLSPVITVGQSTAGMNTRSTVGTLSDIHDLLRLLYARTGKSEHEMKLSRALFSFNSEVGKCKRCNGLGQEEAIAIEKLVADPEKTLREGALSPTLPTGYIMYSQVTMEVLNQVCEAEGFHVDIPWKNLNEAQKNIILFGSERIKVPFGKHSLESRLKWTGMKAKPREEGYYRGMIPIMSEILRRDRNPNILKYVHPLVCEDCKGTRLNQKALSVKVNNLNIAEVLQMELQELNVWLTQGKWDVIASNIVEEIQSKLKVLIDFGLGHLRINRPANTLRPSEIQRIRLANQISSPLSDVLYIFDEPSIGLQRNENLKLIQYFKGLVAQGNTVVIVEHDLETIKHADYIVELGPQAGSQGGRLLFEGSLEDFQKQEDLKHISPTYNALWKSSVNHQEVKNKKDHAHLKLKGCHERNLKNIEVSFQLGGLNIVSGKSGAGKSTLVKETLLPLVQNHLNNGTSEVKVEQVDHLEDIKDLIFIDHTPIGKTPRSNPTTYLGISDHIRDLFAKQPDAKAKKYTKSRFSFNNKGGRCETCQGAGKTQIGMHFLGHIELICESCEGKRFNPQTLEILYKGKSIADCYQLSVDEALDFFKGAPKVLKGLEMLQKIGLGYLKLGQSSTTLSGGEAQRIKIANQLQKKDNGDTLYIVVEPSTGLHQNNIHTLLDLFDVLTDKGNTVVCIEQDESIIAHADWHIELGPEGGMKGGEVVYQGCPKSLSISEGISLKNLSATTYNSIILNGVKTNGLKNIDVKIPKEQLTVVTGKSGTGKSSLVFDTLYSISQSKFGASLSTFNRSYIQQESRAVLDAFSGLGPAIAIQRKGGVASKRSTVGTLTGLNDHLRLFYSRIAQDEGKNFTAQHFSFNHHLGACPDCQGAGTQLKCDPQILVENPKLSVLEGAFIKNKALDYYSDIHGQFVTTLKHLAELKQWDLTQPWEELEEDIQDVILYGTGDEVYEFEWHYITKTGTGRQNVKAPWLGFCNYIDDEYQRKLHNKSLVHLEALLSECVCETCQGKRLKKELLQVQFESLSIADLQEMELGSLLVWLKEHRQNQNSAIQVISERVFAKLFEVLEVLKDLGLDYLNLNRSVSSLSGGERQRVSLAGQLSAHLFGVVYVLDEPTLGLDKKQVQVLIQLLQQIKSQGNTIVVVEHDKDFISAADYLIELGPEAGQKGGQLIFEGQPKELKSVPSSVTYQLLNKELEEKKALSPNSSQYFGIKGAYAHHLKHIDVSFKSGQITAITGVSGSGKSSLMKEVLYASWERKAPVQCKSTFGLEAFDQVALLDQHLLKQSRLATPASYTGILLHLQQWISKREEAKALGLKSSDFSYQSKKGKCPSCGGYGEIKTAMDFMSDVWLVCDVCQGERYSPELLSCRVLGKNMGDILEMSVNQLHSFISDDKVQKALEVLRKVGLGHLILGQAWNTLSLGEMQRLKLAHILMDTKSGPCLFLLDEPSTGLHYFDIAKLQDVFQAMILKGHTIIYIEHHQSLITFADEVVTLGPGSGVRGGELVY